MPGAGARVLVREGLTSEYDIAIGKSIRAINVVRTLTFATDNDTRLELGSIKIQAGDKISEDGFDEKPSRSQSRSVTSGRRC